MNRSLQRTALAAVGMLAAVSMAWAAPQSQPDEARYKVYLPEIFNGAPVPPPAPSVAVSLSAEPYQVDEDSDPWFDVIVTARNTGQVDAGNIAVTVSYDPSQSALVYWPSNVTAIDNDSVTMVFDGPIAMRPVCLASMPRCGGAPTAGRSLGRCARRTPAGGWRASRWPCKMQPPGGWSLWRARTRRARPPSTPTTATARCSRSRIRPGR